MAENFQSFSKLKKDLLFHEKRLQLLLATHIVEDLENNLHEKTLSREECATDCRRAISAFEQGATETSLSGRWDEIKVSNLFGLEVPLNVILGSSKFEPPTKADRTAITEMIQRLQTISQRFPEFSTGQDEESLRTMMEAVDRVEWNSRDMNKIGEAIGAKLAVLSELNDLANALQSSSYEISKQKSAVEDLRRQEETAVEDGEMALADGALRQKIELLGGVVDQMISQSNAIEVSLENNVTKRKSNINVFQGASAMLECIKAEKEASVNGCIKDIRRIERGMQFEDRTTGVSRGKTRDQLQASLDRIKKLDDRQKFLSNRLIEIFKDFQETEMALEQVGLERSKAIGEHVEMVENSRHATSDMIELSKFAEVYKRNLENTKGEYEKGVSALQTLEKLLLQEQTFDSYDFNAAARRLKSIQKRTCQNLNEALTDYKSQSDDLMRRLMAQQKQVIDEINVVSCEMEVKREIFDPETKHYVEKIRALQRRRDVIAADCAKVEDQASKVEEVCLSLLRHHMSEDEIKRAEDDTFLRALQRKEDLIDMRQQLIEPEDRVITQERLQLMCEKQSTQVGSPSVAITPQQKNSRVLNVRDEVQKSKALLAQLEAELEASDEPSATADAVNVEVTAETSATTTDSKRPIRVIPSHLD